MFGNQKQQPVRQTKKPTVTRDAAVTILTSGCHFNGKLYCRGSSRIGGKIEGEIVSEGLLIIEEGAIITASVFADEAIIQGVVKGKLKAKGRVELCNTARFEGDLTSPVLVVHEGAQFNGRAEMPRVEQVPGNGRLLESVTELSTRGPEAITGNDRYTEKQPEIAAMKADHVPA